MVRRWGLLVLALLLGLTLTWELFAQEGVSNEALFILIVFIWIVDTHDNSRRK